MDAIRALAARMVSHAPAGYARLITAHTKARRTRSARNGKSALAPHARATRKESSPAKTAATSALKWTAPLLRTAAITQEASTRTDAAAADRSTARNDV